MVLRQEFSYYEIKKQNKVLLKEISYNIFTIIMLIFILLLSNKLYHMVTYKSLPYILQGVLCKGDPVNKVGDNLSICMKYKYKNETYYCLYESSYQDYQQVSHKKEFVLVLENIAHTYCTIMDYNKNIFNTEEYLGISLLACLQISVIFLIIFLSYGFYTLYSTLEINEKNLQILRDEMNKSNL